uniref:t-SNARE coiled-coil homology domain-containing protein n=1 Tax=Picea sitchensis TaxID=3332 RepID=D5A8W2_PICSI|nr:unknown [Picea sitchensis]
MSVIDILTRVDAICNKYDKYDIEKHRENQISGSDAFVRLYTVVESDIEAAKQKSDDAAKEKNRAVVATLNAEIRRTKARLHEEIPKLQKLAQKKVKGVSKEDIVARNDLVSALADKIDSIPDGTNAGTVRTAAWKTSATRMEIKIDSSSPGGMNTEFYEHTEESKQFRQDFEMRRAKQDQGLDMISEGLDTLKNMAQDINEVDKATSDLKNTNVRLKDTVNKLRSSRNFCIDIILLCIILGIAAYLYNVLKK